VADTAGRAAGGHPVGDRAHSLRQDLASIEQDRRNAGVLAPDLVRRFGDRIGSTIAEALAARITGSRMVPAQAAPAPQPVCGLVLDGRIRLPGDYPALPSPPTWLSALTDAEASQWRIAAAATPQADLAAVRRATTALAGAPAAVRANAEWLLVRAEAAREGAPQAGQRLADLAARYPDVLSESGTPLADLALLLAMRRSPEGKLPDSLVRSAWTRMLEHPSFMTPALVEDAVRRSPGDPSVMALDVRWRTNELALDLLRRLAADGLTPGEIVLEREGEVWIALITALEPARTDGSEMPCSACHVLLVPASFIGRVLRSAVTAGADRLPDYASALSGSVTGSGIPSKHRQAATAGLNGIGIRPIRVPPPGPSDAIPTFAADLSRVALNALPAGATPPDRPLRLAAPSTGHAFTLGVDPGRARCALRELPPPLLAGDGPDSRGDRGGPDRPGRHLAGVPAAAPAERDEVQLRRERLA
jgi:hypothetical protein